LLPPKAVSYWLLPANVAIPARVAALAPKNWPWVVPVTLPLAVAEPANDASALLMLARSPGSGHHRSGRHQLAGAEVAAKVPLSRLLPLNLFRPATA
jgi:hypothetical protein